MIASIDGVVQPAVGTEDHWAMFTEFRRHPDLFDPMRDLIVQGVADCVAATPARPYIDARQLGASVLDRLTSWWHGEFPRRFKDFSNGADRGIHGMTLWNYLASIPSEWWCFAAQKDSHGYGETAMRYWRLAPSDPLITCGKSLCT
jgi:hypothetical protein